MNLDLRAFLSAFTTEIVFAQVIVRRLEHGFELRHCSDRAAAPETLSTLDGIELRAWAQSTAGGAFRPLKSAPDLRAGWRAVAADGAALELLLCYLYPGAVADWFAAQSPRAPITSYREFTARQTGMYRITAMLSDAVAGAAIRACCAADFCLKRRLWSVEGLAPDELATKSVIPCLEPCAIMLEFSRKVARLEQGSEQAAPETDFDGSRRLRFVLEKQTLAVKPLH